MKYDSRKAFPYPVLPDDPGYNDDYTNSEFQVLVGLEPDEGGRNIVLTAKFKVNEDAILESIGKSAFYAVHVLCAKTNYRRLFRTHERELTYVFKNRELHDKVVLTACVVCTTGIQQYHSPNFHSEFGGAAFDMPQGAVFAIATPEIFYVDADTRLGTVFQLVKNGKVNPGEFDFNCDGDFIDIKMCGEDYTRFNKGRASPHIRKFLIMSVYFPTLIEILRIMHSESGEHEGKRWYRAIRAKLEEMGIELDGERAYQHAQQLLRAPLRRLPLTEE